MDYNRLLEKIEIYKQNYNVKILGYSHFNRPIYAVERVLNQHFSTALLVASTHAREHITTDIVCEMIDSGLFDNITDFNISFILMANPDGVELCINGIESAPEDERQNLIKINGGNLNFSMWKANGKGVDINNNFDANFGQNVHSEVLSSQGFIGEFPESEPETKILADYAKNNDVFLALTYHSKGEEIYYNFFQSGKQLERDSVIAKRFAESTGYLIKNVESSSSGGFKDYVVQKLRLPAITIEVGNDNLSHPISREFLPEIFERHKNVANDLIFAYNIFISYKGWVMAYTEEFMKLAIELAKKAYKKDEVPVGAVIVKDGKVISKAFNKREKSKDATAHAEVIAIKKACKKLKDFRLVGTEMYVSLEPCVMCTGAILNARIENVYFGAYIKNNSISSSELAERAELNHKTNFSGGHLEEISSKMLTDYFKSKRVK